jgi:hypothetical protein
MGIRMRHPEHGEMDVDFPAQVEINLQHGWSVVCTVEEQPLTVSTVELTEKPEVKSEEASEPRKYRRREKVEQTVVL